MATITNRLNLPEPLVRAVEHDGYVRTPGERPRISVSTLLSPPRKAALEIAHADELVEDAADRIWSLLGQVAAVILERAGITGLREHRLVYPVDDWDVSGRIDHYALMPDGTVDDYKLSSVWSAKEGGKDEWVQQLNVYAHMMRHEGYPVKAARIILICRDWRKNEALRYEDYPKEQVVVLPVELWTPAAAEAFIRDRLARHIAAQAILPECTPLERWERPSQWAVMRKGQKRAVKLCDSAGEAFELSAMYPDRSIEPRPGAWVRCEQYCAARPFCSQAKEHEEMAHGD